MYVYVLYVRTYACTSVCALVSICENVLQCVRRRNRPSKREGQQKCTTNRVRAHARTQPHTGTYTLTLTRTYTHNRIVEHKYTQTNPHQRTHALACTHARTHARLHARTRSCAKLGHARMRAHTRSRPSILAKLSTNGRHVGVEHLAARKQQP